MSAREWFLDLLRRRLLDMAKPAELWRRWEFSLLPYRGWDEPVPPLRSLLLLPTRHIHDSGYRAIEVAGEWECEGRVVVYPKRLTGCSHVVHIEGIGGFGHDWYKRYGTVPRLVTPRSWSVDVLPRGVVRLFNSGTIVVGSSLSSFEAYSEERGSGVAS